MNTILPPTIYYGTVSALSEPIPLRAGPLTMQYEDGSLRYIRIGTHEIVRRIYVAVRDRNWDTIEASISIQDQETRTDSFFVRYRAHHQKDDIDFVWDGAISGDTDGTLRFAMDGTALSTFWRNRIGFCVLHPMSCAGARCKVQTINGTILDGIFPVDISPHQPFREIQAITHVVQPGLQAEVRFHGDTFEMEDQRNWSDASYKTYCTPLNLPFPVEIHAGTVIQQSVEVKLIGPAPISSFPDQDKPSEPICLEIRHEVVGRLPRLGLCAASHDQDLSAQEIERLRALNLSHLRVDINFSQLDWDAHFLRQLLECGQWGIVLETALRLTSNAKEELYGLRKILDLVKPRIGAWLLFDESGNSASEETVALAHHILGDYTSQALFAGGTDAFFAQLNRNRPSLDGLDLITYSLTPQVHAFDNASLVENLPAQRSTLESARRFSGGKLLAVSPVTLRMRFNPAATSPDPVPLLHMLPSRVDSRQMSLFGAAWTLGSIKYLAEGGAHAVTYYETTGWLGVMERETGSLLPDQFPSIHGSVFPLYHVLADVGELADAEVLHTSSTDPLTVVGITLRSPRSLCVLVANFSARQRSVQLRGIHGSLRLRMLDEFTAREAMTLPEIYRARSGSLFKTSQNIFSIDLAPFAVAKISLE